jgi:predicted DNA-binding protein
MKKTKRKWLAVQVSPEAKAKLSELKKWDGESEAFHTRRAIEKYHAEQKVLRMSSKREGSL